MRNPLLVGILSDRLDADYGADSLRIALSIIVFAHLWAALHSLLCARTLRRDLRAKEQQRD